MPRSRPRGTGTLQQLPDGRVRAFLPRQGKNGPRPSRIFPTEAEAAAWLRDELAPAASASGPGQPLGTYLLSWYRSLTLAPQTRPNYQRAIRYCADLWDRPLSELTHRDFAALWAAWQRASPARSTSGTPRPGLAVGTVQQLRSILSIALNAAVPDLIPANPIHRARVQRHSPRVDPPHWEKADGQRFLRVADGSQYAALFRLALSIGARPGELRGLRWEDCDLERGTLHIRRSLTENTRDLGPTKTHRERIVKLPPPCVVALRRHRSRQTIVSAWVFCTDQGTPLTSMAFEREYHRLRTLAGVPPMIPYGMRHTAATVAITDGVPLPVVSEMLGHSSPEITSRVYWRVLASQRALAADVMAKAFPLDDETGSPESECADES